MNQKDDCWILVLFHSQLLTIKQIVKIIDVKLELYIIVLFYSVYVLCICYLAHTNNDFLFWIIRLYFLSPLLLSLSICYISARFALRVS